ncbi:hypothetical protein F5Y16DRAFT_357570 [Xylariaceae sp. FL0255]|nr:hypothetical protein F5Y16DRAFT_357570 [Xylariaceae sp. FL0255]
MGIKGLRDAIRRHGVFTVLNGRSVVIDGPSLVYEVFHGCLYHRPVWHKDTFIYHPSYSCLGNLVLGWLENLRSHQIHVRKIYFDGFLPQTKWSTRKDRLRRQSLTVARLLTSHPDGSSVVNEGTFATIKPDISLTRGQRSRTIPQPPFLIAGVLDVLRNSPTWGSLVEVVPGEADIFCAEDVRQHGGTVFTGDSDLLVADLGPDGSVTFFSDLAEADPSVNAGELQAAQISPHQVSGLLGLSNVGGLQRLAFERIQPPEVGYQEALRRAKDVSRNTLDSPEYKAFIREHSMEEYLRHDHPVRPILSSLDPRISELVVQCLLDKPRGISVTNAKNARGPESLTVFLPVMVEDRRRKSVWNVSTAVRQIAYGIMQTFAHGPSSTVTEYRLIESENSPVGRHIEIPSPDETVEQCRLLVDTVKDLAQHSGGSRDASLLWPTFAVYQDLVWSMNEKREPLSLALIPQARALSGIPARYTWDFIHITSQLTSSLYSLRIIQQALVVAAHLCLDLPQSMRELHDLLKSLPSIADWPSLQTVSETLKALERHASLVAKMLEASAEKPQIPIAPSPPVSTRRVRSVDRKAKGGKSVFTQPASTNKFNILSQIDLDT